MQATDRPNRSQQLAKRREACERCRSQKLKCIRTDDSGNEPCLRCLQAQSECIISLRKMPGRPAGRNNNPSQRNCAYYDQSRRTKSMDLESTIDPAMCDATTSNISHDLFLMSSDFSMGGDSSDNTARFSSSSSPVYPQELVDSIFNDPELVTDFNFAWNSHSDQNMVSSQGAFHHLDHNSDPGFKLSILQHKLSKQLISLKSISWDVTAIMKLNSSLCVCQKQTCAEIRNCNPLNSTFEIISEFEHLLSSIRDIMNWKETHGSSGVRQEMKFSYSLTAMSCYVQLICIYDCIFSYVLNQAFSNPSVREFILQSSPNMSLGGFEVPSAPNSCGRLFADLMQLKIEPIELALGLPADYCISKAPKTKRISDGFELFGGKHGESFLAALKESDSRDTNSTDPGVIDALKEKISRIQSMG